jgi:hypothetical protein
MRQAEELRWRICRREQYGYRRIVSVGLHVAEPPLLGGNGQIGAWSRVAPQSRLLACDGPGVQVLRVASTEVVAKFRLVGVAS